MEDCGELQNLDNFAAVSHGILQTGLQNLVKFSLENCGPYRITSQATQDKSTRLVAVCS